MSHRPRQKQRRTRRIAGSPRLYAMDVAESFIAAAGIPPRRRDHIVSLCLAVGQHLADRGHAGAWELFVAPLFVPMLPLRSAAERDAVLGDLESIIGYLMQRAVLDARHGQRILAELTALRRQSGDDAAALAVDV